MVSVFDIDYRNYKQFDNIYHYYDTLAFVTINGIDYDKTYNKCLFEKCKTCNRYRKVNYKEKYNKYINENLLDINETIRVNSIFGGCCMIKTNVYNKVKWVGDYACEHIGFCELVRDYGNIILDPKIKVCTTSPKDRYYFSIHQELFL